MEIRLSETWEQGRVKVDENVTQFLEVITFFKSEPSIIRFHVNSKMLHMNLNLNKLKLTIYSPNVPSNDAKIFPVEQIHYLGLHLLISYLDSSYNSETTKKP